MKQLRRCRLDRETNGRRARFLWPVLLLVLLGPLAGCVTANFTQPVASFQQSINVSSAVIGAYLTHLNDFERQLYLDDLALDPTQPLERTSPAGQPTPLMGEVFHASAIKARMDSLALLGVYAQRLTNLAGSNAPQQFTAAVSALGGNLTNLDKTFARLSTDNTDKSAAAYIGPVSALIGSLGKIALEQERDKAVREAVNSGAPHVRTILDLLERDLTSAVKPLQETGLLEKVATLVNYYNDHRQDEGVDARGRTELLTDIRDRAAAYEASVAFNPTTLIGAIRQAHDALVKYANAPGTPGNFADLITALQALDQSAQDVAKQIDLIRQIQKGR